MKRDLKLIKEILIKIESKETLNAENIVEFNGYTESQITYHIMLLDQVGFIETLNASDNDGFEFWPKYLTWNGQEFLATIRNDSAWNKFKGKLSGKISNIPFSALQIILQKLITESY
ncbi:DUF2513 domain-containing protein [Marivirga tractuosa]|uniref:DUF2513 domain-containing protein n=1 Tax=Marivirga tractuosa TaxID=1006 RepID=UPI0035CF3610